MKSMSVASIKFCEDLAKDIVAIRGKNENPRIIFDVVTVENIHKTTVPYILEKTK